MEPEKVTPQKRRFLLETIIFRCYVSFGEGVSKNRGIPQNGWFITKLIKMDDLGGTIIFGKTHIYIYIYLPT